MILVWYQFVSGSFVFGSKQMFILKYNHWFGISLCGGFVFGSKQMFILKYNQEAKQWDVILKENKAYEWIPILTAKIVNSRM